MEQGLLAHVGSNIRLFRRARNLTLEELAARIHKSRASVSKYEAGQVAIDLVTLFDIARALQVAPVQLFDCLPPAVPPAEAMVRNPFLQTDLLYMYNLYDGEIFFSVLKLFYNHNTNQLEATIFYKMQEDAPQDYGKCDCIYHGRVLSQDFVLSCLLTNIHNDMETALLNLSIPMRNVAEVCGMLCGLEVNTCEPVALKILLSRNKLPHNTALREKLAFSPRSFKELRSKNKLFVRND